MSIFRYTERQCSKCYCNEKECYFGGSNFECSKCPDTLTLTPSIVVFVVLIIIFVSNSGLEKNLKMEFSAKFPAIFYRVLVVTLFLLYFYISFVLFLYFDPKKVILARSPIFFLVLVIVVILIGSLNYGASYVLSFFLILIALKLQMNAPPNIGYWTILLNYVQTLYPQFCGNVTVTFINGEICFLRKFSMAK